MDHRQQLEKNANQTHLWASMQNLDRSTTMIYHMVPTAVWQALPLDEPYRAATLESEGFIHCTQEPDRLVWVANQFYRESTGAFTILAIDPAALQAEVRWEEADDDLFPHIYGPINRNAVRMTIPFPRDSDGRFLSLEISSLATSPSEIR